MINVKILYNKDYIDDEKKFNDKVDTLKEKYKDNFSVQVSEDKTFDLLIDDNVVYTLDDNFSNVNIPTETIIDKIDYHIFKIKALKRTKNNSKFDDIGLIDY